MTPEYVYILCAVSAGRNSDEDRYERYMSSKFKGDYKRYCRFLKSWGEYTYNASWWAAGYFQSYEKACKAAENNSGDINEAGVYPYAAVIKMPLNCVYPNSYLSTEDITLFEYQEDDDSYKVMSKETSFTIFLRSQLSGMMNEEIARKIEVIE